MPFEVHTKSPFKAILRQRQNLALDAEAEILAKKLSDIDYIPGIDLPGDSNKKRQLASEERELREAEQQNAEFDEEADRLFGVDTESEEASDEDIEMEQGEEEGDDEMSELVSENSGSPQQQSAENEDDLIHPSSKQNGSPASNGGLDAASELHASQGMASVALDKPPEGTHKPPSAAVLDHLQ